MITRQGINKVHNITRYRRLVAYHKAGHVIVGKLVGENALPSSREYINNHIKIALGGRAAEELLYNDINKVTTMAHSDFKIVTDLVYDSIEKYGFTDVGKLVVSDRMSDATRAHIDREAYKIVDSAYDEVVENLKMNWSDVVDTACVLMDDV
jgi:cell division protease FtsH